MTLGRWKVAVCLSVSAVLVAAVPFVMFRERPIVTDSAVIIAEHEATGPSSAPLGAAANPAPRKGDGEPVRPEGRLTEAGETAPAGSPTVPMTSARSDPISASMANVVQQVAPSVATIFVKESDGAGLGSGFLVHSSRHLVTNYHVIERASRAVAIQRRPDGTEGVRRVIQGFVACEPQADLVLLVLAEDWPAKPLSLARHTTALGTNVFAVGNPHGLVGTVTRGIVTGMRKAGELEHCGLAPRTPLVQTDTFFSKGSSGGPLCDENGSVVGVTAFGVSFMNGGRESDADVFRFAISAAEVRALVQRRAGTVQPLSQLPRSRK